MSIYRRKSGKWAVLVDLDRDAHGKRRRRSLGTFPTRKAAEAAEREALTARDRGIDLSPATTKTSDLFSRFLADAASRCSAKTLERYQQLAGRNILPRLGDVPLAKLRPAHVADLYATLLQDGRVDGSGGLSRRTVHHCHRLLFSVFGWAERMQLVARNPVRAVDPPKPGRSDAVALTADEAARLLEAAEGTRWQPFLALALATGARRGELCALSWNDVDFEARRITIRRSLSQTRSGLSIKSTKTDRVRSVALSGLGVEALRRLRVSQAAEKLAAGSAYEDQGFVFADPLGRPIKPFNYSDAFARLARKARLSTTRLHVTRHTAATWMIAEGTDVRTVGAILGHSAASTTLNLYAHHVADLQAGAVSGIESRLTAARDRRRAAGDAS